MNKVILIGRLTKDIDLRKTDSDKAVARFTLAVNRRYKNANGEFDADFSSCVAFGKTAEFINTYFKKGSAIAIEGSIQTGSYEKDGTKVYTTDVVVDNAEFVEKKGSGNSNNVKSNEESASEGINELADAGSEDDLPF